MQLNHLKSILVGHVTRANDVVDVFSDFFVCLSLFADKSKLYTCYKVDMLYNDLHTAVNRLIEWAKLLSYQLQYQSDQHLASLIHSRIFQQVI